MSSHLARLATFATWPSTAVVSSLALARSGFKYTGQGESTVCTECQLAVDSWQQGDQPGQVHRQRSPNCPFVRENLQLAADSSSSVATTEHSSQNYDITAGDRTDLVGSVNSRFQKSCLINRDNPDFEVLKDENVRFLTFYDWPESAARIVDARELAKAGLFYTGQADRVRCAYCFGSLRGWEPGDRPADEHRRHFPNCWFVRNANGGAFDVVDHKLPVAKQLSTSVPSHGNPPTFRSTASERQRSASSRPKHPDFTSEQSRVESFRESRVPRGQSVEVLAKAGFFHVGPGDNVRCYSCGGGLKNFQPSDEPWKEHKRLFPFCPHLKERQNVSQVPTQHVPQHHVPHNSVPNHAEPPQPRLTPAASEASQSNVEYRIEPREIKARLDAPVVQAVLKMGYSRDTIRKVIERRLVSTGDDFPNVHALLEAVFSLEEEANHPARPTENSQATAAASASSVPAASPPAALVNSAANFTRTSVVASVTNLPVISERDTTPASSEVYTNDSPVAPKPKPKKKKKKKNKNSAATNDASSADVKTNDTSAAPAASANHIFNSVPTTTMLAENEKLKEERTCKVCMDAEVNMVFLPCGHFVCCAECSQQLQKCPICRVCISGTVRASIT